MKFVSEEHLNAFLNNLLYLGMGSQGVCYCDLRSNTIYKIFHFWGNDENSAAYDENKILRFSNIDNNTFIWPIDIIKIKDEIVGYKSKYIKANNLYKINPLSINLEKLCKAIENARKDIKLISQQGVVTYDMAYNTLYDKKFYIIDQDEYSYSDMDSSVIEKNNNNNFDYEIYLFLVDTYFNRIVNNNKLLNELYKNKKEDILIFIKELRNYLSELVGENIKYLKDAKKYIDKDSKSSIYQRILLK